MQSAKCKVQSALITRIIFILWLCFADQVAAAKDGDDEDEEGGNLLVSLLSAASLMASTPGILIGDAIKMCSVGINMKLCCI